MFVHQQVQTYIQKFFHQMHVNDSIIEEFLKLCPEHDVLQEVKTTTWNMNQMKFHEQFWTHMRPQKIMPHLNL